MSNLRFYQTGITLVELLTMVVILGVVFSVGTPLFNSVRANTQLSTLANDFSTSLALARSEAVTRNNQVTICASEDGVVCSGSTNWENGWLIFTDDAGSRSVQDGADELLRTQVYRNPGAISFTADASALHYQSDGSVEKTE